MRDLKFRAWDAANKEMYQARTLTWDRALNYAEGQDEVMQFTGLLDKAGVEIYEGDIIDRIFIGGDEYGCSDVFFGDGAFSLHCGPKYTPCLYEADERYIEVIGNIHQNPELLK